MQTTKSYLPGLTLPRYWALFAVRLTSTLNQPSLSRTAEVRQRGGASPNAAEVGV